MSKYKHIPHSDSEMLGAYAGSSKLPRCFQHSILVQTKSPHVSRGDSRPRLSAKRGAIPVWRGCPRPPKAVDVGASVIARALWGGQDFTACGTTIRVQPSGRTRPSQAVERVGRCRSLHEASTGFAGKKQTCAETTTALVQVASRQRKCGAGASARKVGPKPCRRASLDLDGRGRPSPHEQWRLILWGLAQKNRSKILTPAPALLPAFSICCRLELWSWNPSGFHPARDG
jgi:hypothetical protein